MAKTTELDAHRYIECLCMPMGFPSLKLKGPYLFQHVHKVRSIKTLFIKFGVNPTEHVWGELESGPGTNC